MELEKKYESLIQSIFDDFKLKSKKFNKNNFIGALVNDFNFVQFRTNFMMRLQNMKTYIERIENSNAQEEIKSKIFKILKELTDLKNYEGAYAEFSAFSNLIRIFPSPYSFYKIQCEVDMDAKKTLAGYKNKKITNYDFAISNILIDVKAFRDKIFKLIQETFNDVLRENKIDDLHMLPEIDCYICYKQITKNREKIKNEIREALQQILQGDNKELVKRSEIIDCLKYRFLKDSGILIGHSIFNPYFFAMQEHQIVFEHINKLHMDNPTILMYVIHPWFSDTNLTIRFDQNDEIALRSFSRRIFMQYKNKQIKIGGKEIINPFQFLSAILFIVDNSIQNEEDQLFFCVNPNAKHKINSYFKDYLQNYCLVDDFVFDNY